MYNDAFVSFPVLETERLILRQHKDSDADDVYEYAQNREAFIFTDGFPDTYEEIKGMLNIWQNEAYNSKQFIRWAIELKNEKKVIGGIYLYAPCGNDDSGRRMDIGYEISYKYWSKGYASEAIRVISKYGLTHMGLVRIQAQVNSENIGSIRACEKAGYLNEGILRNFYHCERNGNRFVTAVMLSCISSDITV